MTEFTHGDPVTVHDDEAGRMWAIADELSLAGIATHLHRTRGVLDLTATMRQPGHRETDVVVDQDGYTELHYWADPDATPAEVAYAITSALAAVTPNLARSARAASRTMPRRADGPITGYDGAVTECTGDGTMPGPPDQLTEPGQSRESVRPRESDPVDAELRQRMEDLSPGHPSSPYKGDGSPKPPVPDPFKNELPIPGDPGYHPDTPSEPQADLAADELPGSDASPEGNGADLSLDVEEKPCVGPDGSWEWKGYPLSPDESRTADAALARWRDAEGRDADGNYGEQGLTPAMQRIEAQLDHGHLVDKSEEYALKTPDRFKEKLAREKVKNPDKTVSEIASEIHDAVRYTFILEVGEYTDAYWTAQERIEGAGYELEVRRNMWTKLEYKGVNSRWRDPGTNLPFEIQFHTQASWDAKQQTHPAYEKIEDTRTPVNERERLREYQKEMSAEIRQPPQVMEIPDYSKKV